LVLAKPNVIMNAIRFRGLAVAAEGFNRVIKQTKRVGCGYRNMINYRRRILSHIVVTRPHRSAA
jgi:transposase